MAIKYSVCMKFSRNNATPCRSLCNSAGDEGIRTPDPLLARQVLSQLSYTPVYQGFYSFVLSSSDYWA